MLPAEIAPSELPSFADELIREIVEEELAAATSSEAEERSDETPIPIPGFRSETAPGAARQPIG